MDATKPYEFIWYGDVHGPIPYKFIGLRWALLSQTPVAGLQRSWEEGGAGSKLPGYPGSGHTQYPYARDLGLLVVTWLGGSLDIF